MFERFFDDLPDGACWLYGKMLKDFAKAVDKDRARLAVTEGSEVGTPFGRFLYPSPNPGKTSFPFEVLPGGGDDPNSVKISLNSWLLKDAKPTNKITITGLDESFTINPGQRIWLEIDISATYSSTPGPITASIQHGDSWGSGKSFYPLPVEYDTSDGTRLGPTGTPPDNTKQIKIYIPIAYCTTKEADDWHLVEKGFAKGIGDNAYIVQQLRTNLMLGGNCVDGGQVLFANPSPYAPQPS